MPSTPPPTRIAFIGVGGIAQEHLRSLHTIDGAQVVAVCDVDPAHAQQAAAPWGARTYSDYEPMLDAESLDALYICVPPFAHTGQELAAIQRGLPFFVEKPLDPGTGYAEQVAAALAARPLITAVGYQWRFFASVERARQLIGDQPIAMVLGYWLDAMPPPVWWRQKRSEEHTSELQSR